MSQDIFVGILIPFAGTTAGAAMVFFMKEIIHDQMQKILLGFASGVMIAASFWSLMLPSIEMAAEQGRIVWLPAAAGFLSGMAFLLLLDAVMPLLPFMEGAVEKSEIRMKKTSMLLFAVTLHNIPEGMAVGISFAGVTAGNNAVSMAGAFALAVGIAIQNLPEGAIISMPLRNEGMGRGRAFWYGTLSGAVEPLAAAATLLLTHYIIWLLPYFLAFAAGAMIYVVVEELIPEAQHGKHSKMATAGVAVGFVLMMMLDVILG